LGLFNLKDYLPKKPGDVELKVIKEMFEASVNGEPFDMERWGQYFKPAGMSQNTGDPNTVRKAAVLDDEYDSEPATVKTSAPVQEAKPSGDGSSKANDILAMIRNRKQNA
jgi:hypothetical protein